MPEGKPPFEILYREHVNRIYAFLRSQLGSADDAEDVTSQVFMKAYEAYPRYEARHDTPVSWLFQIARNAALDQHRRRGRQERLRRLVAQQPEPVDDPTSTAERNLAYRRLMDAVAMLPDRQREVVGLRHSGLSFLEVGRLMGCSEDAAKMLHHRALKVLRERLRDEA